MIKLNELLVVFLAAYLLQLLFSIIIEKLNRRHLERRGGHVSRRFEGFIDAESLEKINAYTQDKSRLAVINGVTSELILLGLLLGGFLSSVDAHLAACRLHDVWAGLL
ncbi:MAG: hypothetical protein JRG73_17335, partial [Deltaproteobacteria bacterium]|nr:hypothetical protein [Deltaproteobacteria bacterium]